MSIGGSNGFAATVSRLSGASELQLVSIQEENSEDFGSADLNYQGLEEEEQEEHVDQDETEEVDVLKQNNSTHETSLCDGEKE